LERIEQAEISITHYITDRLSRQQQRISQLATLIPTLALRTLNDSRHHIDMLQSRLPVALERRLTHQKHRLENLEIQMKSFDPQLLLSRGYSITLFQGKAIHDPTKLHPGDEIETRVEKGIIRSVVKS
jgi:exodeoxyribonuclease VII large subunit